VKVAIVSAKAYNFDRRRAKELGADGYITKPLDVSNFASDIRDIIEATFRIKYWGVRGTLPVPGPSSLRYGGSTSCVTMPPMTARLFLMQGLASKVSQIM
jgi:CheY-like chemotaxis protein